MNSFPNPAKIRFIDVCAPFHEVIEAAGQCEHIVSSALHGLVLADALEIPNRWLWWVDDADRDLLGKPEFKYRDYYSAFGMADMPYIQPVKIRSIPSSLGYSPKAAGTGALAARVG